MRRQENLKNLAEYWKKISESKENPTNLCSKERRHGWRSSRRNNRPALGQIKIWGEEDRLNPQRWRTRNATQELAVASSRRLPLGKRRRNNVRWKGAKGCDSRGHGVGALKGAEARSHPTFCSRRGDSLIPGLGVSKSVSRARFALRRPFWCLSPPDDKQRENGRAPRRASAEHRIWVEAAPRGDTTRREKVRSLPFSLAAVDYY